MQLRKISKYDVFANFTKQVAAKIYKFKRKLGFRSSPFLDQKITKT